MTTPAFRIGQLVKVTGISGCIDDVIEYEDGSFGYTVVSTTERWLERHVIVEAAICAV